MAKTKLISERNVEWKDILCKQYNYLDDCKSEISYNDFLDDCENLIYLLESAYAGYDDMTNKGFNPEKFIRDCKENFQNRDLILVSEISEYYYKYLISYISDTHCFIESLNFRKNFIKSNFVIFSDIYVTKKANKFFIYKKNNLNLPLNTEIDIKAKYLFKYPSEGKSVYRVGNLIDDSYTDTAIVFYLNGKEYELRCDKNVHTKNQLTIDELTNYRKIETDKSVYIDIKTFIDLPKGTIYRDKLDKVYLDFANAGKKYRNKQNIILDLRSNGGGNSLHPSKFLNNLVSDKHIKNFDSFNNVFLISPAIYQVIQNILKTTYSKSDSNYKEYVSLLDLFQKSQRREFLSTNFIDRKKIKSKFKGKLIILVDKGTASSSELLILYAKELLEKSNQIVLIGENSYGCFNYGNIFHYQLKNSGITFSLAQFKMENAQIIEGTGFMPDYWATNEDIVQSLVNLTSDDELFEKLQKLNNNY